MQRRAGGDCPGGDDGQRSRSRPPTVATPLTIRLRRRLRSRDRGPAHRGATRLSGMAIEATTSFVHETLPQRILFGAGAAASNLRDEAERRGATRVMLIATVRDTGLVEALAGTLPVVRH